MDEKVKKGDKQVLLATVDAEDGQGKLKTVSPSKDNQSSISGCYLAKVAVYKSVF
ncbi:hypothetical protein FACS1894182_04690 [Bacteroidia bacterium]|nr:hypothetical protein FACS1894182_04690 [Bacteroidia bacterium]